MLRPKTLAGDDKYTKASHICHLAKHSVILLTDSVLRFIQKAENIKSLRYRGTSLEPFFDLVAKVLGIDGKTKPLSGLETF